MDPWHQRLRHENRPSTHRPALAPMGENHVSPAGGHANGTREVFGMQSGDGASDDIVWVRRHEGREKMSQVQ